MPEGRESPTAALRLTAALRSVALRLTAASRHREARSDPGMKLQDRVQVGSLSIDFMCGLTTSNLRFASSFLLANRQIRRCEVSQ